MATSPLNDPYTHLSALVAQLVRQNQTLIGHIDRVATGLFEVSQDARVYHASIDKALGGLREELHAEIASLRSEIGAMRTEMLARFDAVGRRFDELEERTARMERSIENLRSDFLRMENGLLNAQQSALQAHIRLDQGPDSPPGE